MNILLRVGWLEPLSFRVIPKYSRLGVVMQDFWLSQLLDLEVKTRSDVCAKFLPALLGWLKYTSSAWSLDHSFGRFEVDCLVHSTGTSAQKKPYFFISIKEPGSNLALYVQHLTYSASRAELAGCRYVVITDGRELHVYEQNDLSQLQQVLVLNKVSQRSSLEQLYKVLNANLFIEDAKAARSCKVLAIYNNKGGVGKTTLSINLGAALVDLGYRVLIVDMDAQANSTLGLGIYPPNAIDRNVVSLFKNHPRSSIDNVIWRNCNGNSIDLVPSNIDLYRVLLEFQGSRNRWENVLLEMIDSSEAVGDFDFILLDTPPAMDASFELAVNAADAMIVPSDLRPFSIYGLSQLLAGVRGRTQILGVVGNNVDLAMNTAKPIADITGNHKLGVFPQIIHTRNCISQASGLGVTVFQMERQKRGNAAAVAAAEFRILAKQIVSKLEFRTSCKQAEENSTRLSVQSETEALVLT